MLPLSRTMRFRDSNVEAIDLVNGPADFDGVLVDDNGDVVATWSSFAYQSGGEGGQVNRGVGAEANRRRSARRPQGPGPGVAPVCARISRRYRCCESTRPVARSDRAEAQGVDGLPRRW